MRNILAGGLAACTLAVSTLAFADANTFSRKLHGFAATPSGSTTNTHGSGEGQLIVHSSGNVYGIRDGGGSAGAGTFFRMTPDGTFTVLHNFGPSLAAGQKQARYPKVIVEDAAGDIYIGLQFGGSGTGEEGAGLVKYSPGTGTLTGLPPTADAISISGFTALVEGGDGYLYAAADSGIPPPPNQVNTSGVIFKVAKTTGAQAALRFFNSQVNPEDGHSPGSLVRGTDGYFYGHNIQGGGVLLPDNSREASGSLFRINATGSTYQTLHLFRKSEAATSGETPIALILGSDGYLWGQTQTGGTTNDMGPRDGGGVLFRYTIATQTYTPVAMRNPVRDHTGQSGGAFRGHPLVEYGDRLYTIHPAAAYRVGKDGVTDSLHVFQQQDGYFLDDLAIGADGTIYVLAGFYGLTSSTGNGSITQMVLEPDPAPLSLTANPNVVPDGGGTALTWEGTGTACYSYGGGPYDGTYSAQWGDVDRAASGCAQSVINHGSYSGSLKLFYAMRCEANGGYVTASRTVTMLAEEGTATGPACPGGGGGEPGDPIALVKGEPRAISGADDSAQEFYFDVPAGATSADIATTGGSGDLDLYVRLGQRATTSTYDCNSAGGSNTESCAEDSPVAGRYYVLVHGWSAFSGASIVANYTMPAGGGDPPPDEGGDEEGGGGGGAMSLGLLLFALLRRRR